MGILGRWWWRPGEGLATYVNFFEYFYPLAIPSTPSQLFYCNHRIYLATLYLVFFFWDTFFTVLYILFTFSGVHRDAKPARAL